MEIIKEPLSTGLTAILVPMSGTNTITEIFMARAGSKYETKEIQGLSHFSEHLAFKGTYNRPTAQDIAREVDSRGGVINAFTSEEFTGYWLRMSARFTEVVNDLISDMLLNSKFDPEEIEKEKGTIIEEIRMCVDNPIIYIGILVAKLLYGDQPAGRFIGGTEESVKNIRREQFVDYIKKLYVASNSAICVAGCIENPEKLLGDLEIYFQGINRDKPGIEKPPVIERQRKPKVLLQHRDTAQTHVFLGVRGYNITHPQKSALQVLQILLGGNMSSRMFMEVRQRRGLAYYIATMTDLQTDVGSLFTRAGLNQEKITEALEVIMEQYRKVAEEKVSEEELRGVKDCIIGRQELDIENPQMVALSLVQQFILTNDIETFEEKIERIEAVTAEDVQRVAQDIFRNKNLNLAIIGPHKDMEERFYQILRF